MIAIQTTTALLEEHGITQNMEDSPFFTKNEGLENGNRLETFVSFNEGYGLSGIRISEVTKHGSNKSKFEVHVMGDMVTQSYRASTDASVSALVADRTHVKIQYHYFDPTGKIETKIGDFRILTEDLEQEYDRGWKDVKSTRVRDLFKRKRPIPERDLARLQALPFLTSVEWV
jgi:hypothetical protein